MILYHNDDFHLCYFSWWSKSWSEWCFELTFQSINNYCPFIKGLCENSKGKKRNFFPRAGGLTPAHRSLLSVETRGWTCFRSCKLFFQCYECAKLGSQTVQGDGTCDGLSQKYALKLSTHVTTFERTMTCGKFSYHSHRILAEQSSDPDFSWWGGNLCPKHLRVWPTTGWEPFR